MILQRVQGCLKSFGRLSAVNTGNILGPFQANVEAIQSCAS